MVREYVQMDENGGSLSMPIISGDEDNDEKRK